MLAFAALFIAARLTADVRSGSMRLPDDHNVVLLLVHFLITVVSVR